MEVKDMVGIFNKNGFRPDCVYIMRRASVDDREDFVEIQIEGNKYIFDREQLIRALKVFRVCSFYGKK